MPELLDEKDQQTLINLMISDTDVFTRVRPILKPVYFSKKFHRTIDYLLDFSNKYNALPTLDQLNNESRLEYSIIPSVKENINIQRSVLDSVEAFCKQRALELAVLEVAEMVNKGSRTGIDQIIKEAQMISIQKDLGIDFWEHQDEWLEKLNVEMGEVKTGWETFDKLLDGGFSWGSLSYIVSCSGGGKSLALANLGLNFSCKGYNVVYLTLELDQELVGKRLMAMASNIPYRELKYRQEKAIDTLLFKSKEIKPGKFRIVNLRNGATTNEVESLIQELEIQTNCSYNIIIVDYADLMKCNDSRINPNDIHLIGKHIAEELRGFARERTHLGKNTLILTASQIGKDAMSEMEYDTSQIAGSVAKTNTADLIFSVRTNLAMKQRGEYELKVLKARNAGCVDKKLKLKYNIDTLLMSDMEEVQDTSPLGNQETVSNAIATLNKLKQS